MWKDRGKQPSKRTEYPPPPERFCQGTTIPGGVEATPRDIACKPEEVPPKYLVPILLEGNLRTKMIQQERQPIVAE